MDYIINPMLFYWLDIVDTVKTVLLVAIIIIGIVFVCMIISHYVDDEPKKKTIIRMGVALAVIIVACIFIPSKQTLIEMQIARYATKQNVEVGIEAIKSATDYVIEAIQSLK